MAFLAFKKACKYDWGTAPVAFGEQQVEIHGFVTSIEAKTMGPKSMDKEVPPVLKTNRELGQDLTT